MGKETDPIQAAIAASDRPEVVDRRKKAGAASTAVGVENTRIDRWIVDTWEKAVDASRRTFRAQFRGEKWRGMSILFTHRRGFSTDWRTFKTRAYLEYEISWCGLIVRRHFAPASLADVKAEAKRIAVVMLAWKESEAVSG